MRSQGKKNTKQTRNLPDGSLGVPVRSTKLFRRLVDRRLVVDPNPRSIQPLGSGKEGTRLLVAPGRKRKFWFEGETYAWVLTSPATGEGKIFRIVG